MRELSRRAAATTRHPATRKEAASPARGAIALVGKGRVGNALAGALRARGVEVRGPLGRGEVALAADRRGGTHAVLLCVPDAEIPAAARAVDGAPLVGHTSGATPLSALAAARRAERFGLHPLQTFTGEDDERRLAGSGCAVAGSTASALRFARELATRLDLVPFEISDERRAAYHAAASTASNFLVALEDLAEEMAGAAGLSADAARRALAPLVRATVDNWAALGPERALTGPVARGDERTVALQREAFASHDPRLLPLFDELVARTRAIAGRVPVADAEVAR